MAAITMAAAPIMAGAAHEPPWIAAALVERGATALEEGPPVEIVLFPAGAVPTGATVTVPLGVGNGAVTELRVVETGTTEVVSMADEAAVVVTIEEGGDAAAGTIAVDDGRVAVRVTPLAPQSDLAKARVVAMSAASQAASISVVTWEMKAALAQIQAMAPTPQPGTAAVARPVTIVVAQAGRLPV